MQLQCLASIRSNELYVLEANLPVEYVEAEYGHNTECLLS